MEWVLNRANQLGKPVYEANRLLRAHKDTSPNIGNGTSESWTLDLLRAELEQFSDGHEL